MSLFDEQPFAPVPERPSLANLRAAIGSCRACERYAEATQPVMGEGQKGALVKHFRFTRRGQRRIHQTPERVPVAACRPWLETELRVVAPRALVLLGATAAQALLGSHIRIGRDRGAPQESDLAELVTLTAHPSSMLRTDGPSRSEAMDQLVADLATVARFLEAAGQ